MQRKYTSVVLVSLLALVRPFTVDAQVVRGQVIDAISGDSLVDVHVTNVARGTGTVTNTSGYFRIATQATDSLRFSSTGYRSRVIVAPSGLARVRLMPDTILLPGISVLANRVTMYRDTTAQPLRLPGVPHVENPVRVKPMTWTWGRKGITDDFLQASLAPVNGVLQGPISYFMRYEKDQRKYEQVQETAFAQRNYRQVVSDEATRALFTREFQLTDTQYDSLLIVFNREQLALVEGTSREAVIGILFRFFNDAFRNQE